MTTSPPETLSHKPGRASGIEWQYSSTDGLQAAFEPAPPPEVDRYGRYRVPTGRPPSRPRWFLGFGLLALTFFTCTTLGSGWYLATRTDVTTTLLPWLGPETIREVWGDSELLLVGLAFSLPTLFILLCHEMGHYLACRFYRLPSSLPYFLPVPVGFGTMGAFIRIRAVMESKKQLFDVGVAGPLAGFFALLPFLVIGIALSEPAPLLLADPAFPHALELLKPGTNLLIWLLTLAIHGPLPDGFVLDFHPFALAAWVGLLVTALNLLPFGQLDGGHILYAANPKLQHRLAGPLWWLVLAAGYFFPGWILWAVIVRWVIGLRHPPVLDEHTPLGDSRITIAYVAVVIFVISFILVPATWIPVAG